MSLLFGERGKAIVFCGKRTGRISSSRILRKGISLTAAATIINFTPITRSAGLFHPAKATIGVEGRAFFPDF